MPVAWASDRTRIPLGNRYLRQVLHGMFLAALCSSWTYFGALGVALNGRWLFLVPRVAVDVKEIAGEFLIPVLKDSAVGRSVNLTVGGRYSDYSIYGSTGTYKAEFDYRLVQALLLRGGYERAVRVPNFAEGFAPATGTITQVGLPSQGFVGDPCGIQSSARTGASAAQVRTLCLAQTPGGSAAAVDNYVQNVGALTATTLGNLESEFGSFGRVGLDATVNYLLHFGVQTLPGTAFVEYRGNLGDTLAGSGGVQAQPTVRALTTLSYRGTGFDLGLRWRYTSSLRDQTALTNPATTTLSEAAYSLFDLFGTVTVNARFSLRIGVNNLFDRSIVQVSGVAGQTAPQIYDVVGRYFFVGARAHF